MSSALESTFFAVSVKDGIAEIEMNKPDKANAMSPDFWHDLPRIMKALSEDPAVRVAILSGRGRHFTGGMDLATFQDVIALTQKEPGRAAYALRHLVLKLQRALSSLEEAPFPVIAAIHGVCLGGGIDLVSAADMRLSTRDASFGIEEIHIGMTADVGTLQRLPKIMPPGIVRELTYTGRRFSPQEAQAWGLVNAVHEDQTALMDAARALAADIAAKSPLAIAGAKQAITYARDHSVADSLDQIATWNAGMLRPEDLMKAMEAKMHKKQAEFSNLLAETG